jgi:hypothetical protein
LKTYKKGLFIGFRGKQDLPASFCSFSFYAFIGFFDSREPRPRKPDSKQGDDQARDRRACACTCFYGTIQAHTRKRESQKARIKYHRTEQRRERNE